MTPTYRTSPTIRFVLAGVAALASVVLVAIGAWTLLNLVARHTFTTTATYNGVRSLIVDTGGGDVHLTAASGSQLHVISHVTEDLSTPKRQAVRSSGGVLRLKASCGSVVNTQCDVSYDIAVPAGVAVHVDSGAGDVTARDLNTTAAVDLHSGAGNVSATGIGASQLRLSSGAGDVNARLLRPAALVKASSGAGDVTLTVPDVVYAVHAHSGAGTVSDSRLRIDPSSAYRIDATSGAGDVTIKPG